MGTMTSRERVLATIDHKEPDRVPIDLGGSVVTGISAIAYYNLKQHLGITEGHTRVIDVLQQLANVEDFLIDKFQIDCLDVGRAFNLDPEDWYDFDLKGIPVQFPNWFQPRENANGSYDVLHRDGTVIATKTEGAFYFEQTYFPYFNGYPENLDNFLDAVNHLPWYYCPSPPFDNMNKKRFWSLLKNKAVELRKKTNKVLVLRVGGSLFEVGYALRRLDRFLMDLIRNPTQIEGIVEKLLDLSLATLGSVCHYLGDTIDIVQIGDDLGANTGPFMNPRLYREIFKPRLKEICTYIKKHSQMKIFFHSCGSIRPLIQDFIDAGIDILNPVQTNVKNMDPKELKDEFGEELTFWGGGADTRNVLNRKTPKEVEKHVLEMLEIFAPGGGYVWSAIHNILPDVPPENIVAAFDAIEKYNNMQ